jgi:hypothetical protein
MTKNVVGRCPALVPDGYADVATAAARASQGARTFEVVVACATCGAQQAFRGTVPEIGDAAEAWQRGHHCATRLGEGAQR